MGKVVWSDVGIGVGVGLLHAMAPEVDIKLGLTGNLTLTNGVEIAAPFLAMGAVMFDIQTPLAQKLILATTPRATERIVAMVRGTPVPTLRTVQKPSEVIRVVGTPARGVSAYAGASGSTTARIETELRGIRSV